MWDQRSPAAAPAIEAGGDPASAAHDPPPGRWVMHQRWHDLLFAHWRVPPALLRPRLPAPLELDTYQGDAWVSIIPFHMSGVRFRWAPPIPTAHKFAELNVRTYVTCHGRTGIWFFSLDAASTLAVVGARAGAGLPYFRAAMRVDLGSRWIDYQSDRIASSARRASFHANYAPRGAGSVAVPGSLEHFLVERYALFSHHGRRILRIDVDHPKWELYGAEAAITRNTMLEAASVTAVPDAPLLQFATTQDVRFWPPVRVG